MPLPARLRAPPLPLPCLLASTASSNLLSASRRDRFFPQNVQYVSRISMSNCGLQSFLYARSNKGTVEADADEAEEVKIHFGPLKQKIEAVGIHCDSCTPGQFDLLYCPKCKGGQSIHRTLSFHISENWSYAIWRCYQLHCGWEGKVFADTRRTHGSVNLHDKRSMGRELTVESLRLEMLEDELLTYFAERKISKEVLHRNNVMQVAGNQKIIAFTYRRNGELVGCKYRTIEKRYWQEKNTEKMFYGLDDIVEANEIIIVEGEIDKLSMEEAGYCNCVSVPDGAPQIVSLKEPPSKEKDTRFQYLWNCEHYLDKAHQIFLATDSDAPGEALAEELARRLGRERCCRVQWPKKDVSSPFKDANEVLMYLGADGLKDVIENAKFCRPD